jgi:hypothetical protein
MGPVYTDDNYEGRVDTVRVQGVKHCMKYHLEGSGPTGMVMKYKDKKRRVSVAYTVKGLRQCLIYVRTACHGMYDYERWVGSLCVSYMVSSV